MAIREDRLLTINYKILNLSDVRKLINPVWQEVQELALKGKEPTIKFHVKCFDRSSFTTEDIVIFNDDSIITQRRIKSIHINFAFKEERILNIKLEHGSFKSEEGFISSSDIEMGGTDINWVNSSVTKFQDILNSIPNQENIVKKYSYPSAVLTIVAFFALCLKLADWGYASEANYVKAFHRLLSNSISRGSLIGGTFISIFFGVVIYLLIREQSEDIFPATELQIGPKHTFSEMNKRRKMYLIYSSIVVPIIWIVFEGLITK